jgi:hypothetical protein
MQDKRKIGSHLCNAQYMCFEHIQLSANQEAGTYGIMSPLISRRETTALLLQSSDLSQLSLPIK